MSLESTKKILIYSSVIGAVIGGIFGIRYGNKEPVEIKDTFSMYLGKSIYFSFLHGVIGMIVGATWPVSMPIWWYILAKHQTFRSEVERLIQEKHQVLANDEQHQVLEKFH